MRALRQADPKLCELLAREEQRQCHNVELIASENYTSRAVLEAAGTILTNKYAEGYPGNRYYGGCEWVDEIEQLAIDRAKALYGAEHANVQPHSGASANMAAYYALLEPGDRVMGLRLDQGGHLTHGKPVNFSGRFYQFVSYGLNPETEIIDYDALEAQAIAERPRLIVAGATVYSRIFDFPRLRAIADRVGAYLMVDIAHISGLIAGGVHPSPVPYADVVTSTTHKTLRGPRSGFILCKQQYAKAIDSAVFPGIQGGPLVHIVAAKAVAFHEAMQPEFRDYAQHIVDNARALAAALQQRGLRIVSGGTDNHVFLVDLRSLPHMSGKRAERVLDEVNITVNKNQIPFDPLPPARASGIRLGTPATTTRGFGLPEMEQIAELITCALQHWKDEEALGDVRHRVIDLCSRFPVPGITDTVA
ncbi:MAG: serine hydroxymethyltransferase [Chloroflexi bacterium]|nr:serine hydroxymethyltransferase [Chloroflexota bacterium]